MDAQELRNLQEAYMEVVMNELDEGMNIKQFEKKRRLQKQKENKALEKLSPTRRAGIHNPEKASERAERRWIRSGKMGAGGNLRTNKVRKAKALGELGESAVPGKPAERLGAVTAIPKSEQEAARERTLAKAKAMREKNMKEKEAELEEKRGLWRNMEAKRERGERPAKPGEKGYPKTLNVEELDQIIEGVAFSGEDWWGVSDCDAESCWVYAEP